MTVDGDGVEYVEGGSVNGEGLLFLADDEGIAVHGTDFAEGCSCDCSMGSGASTGGKQSVALDNQLDVVGSRKTCCPMNSSNSARASMPSFLMA